jgi:hypothetical protein
VIYVLEPQRLFLFDPIPRRRERFETATILSPDWPSANCSLTRTKARNVRYHPNSGAGATAMAM